MFLLREALTELHLLRRSWLSSQSTRILLSESASYLPFALPSTCEVFVSWGQGLPGHSAACTPAATLLPRAHLVTTQLLCQLLNSERGSCEGQRKLIIHFLSCGNSALGSCSCLECFPRSPFHLALLLGSIFCQFSKMYVFPAVSWRFNIYPG